jgi:hypothetical protein
MSAFDPLYGTEYGIAAAGVAINAQLHDWPNIGQVTASLYDSSHGAPRREIANLSKRRKDCGFIQSSAGGLRPLLKAAR